MPRMILKQFALKHRPSKHPRIIPPAAVITTSPWMTTAEAAAYLRIKPRTLLLWVRQGKVKGYPLSGIQRRVWRFLQSDLDGTIVGHSQCAAKESSDAA